MKSKLNRYNLIFVHALLALLILLVACAPAATPQPTTQPEVEEAEPTTPPEVEEAEPTTPPEVEEAEPTAPPEVEEPEPTGPVELTLWTNLTTESQATVIQKQVNECLADMPDVTVKFDTVPFGTMYPRLITALQEGDVPNVINSTEGVVAFLQAKNGIVPLDDVIDSLGRDDFVGSYLDAMSKDGQVWAVPDWALHQEVWYRKDLFDEQGLEIPKSWDELLSAAEALTQDTDGDGEIDIYGFAVPMGRVQVAAQTFFQILYSAGAYIFDPDTGEYVFDDDRETAVQAMQFMIDLYKAASPPASIEWSWGDFRTAYVEGNVAMTNEWGAVVLQALDQNPDMLDNMDVFPFPAPNADEEAAAALAGGYFYMVGEAPQAEVDASKQLVQCMYEVDRVAERANSRPIFAIPATKSAFDSETYQGNEMVQRFKPQLDVIFTQVMDNWYRYGMEAGLNPITGQIEATTFIGDAIQNAALDNITAEQAVQQIDEQLQFQLALLGGQNQ
ncbi:MAG: ABC transporter substrate-binding protein [Anaerolineales bacterium]